MSSCAASCSTCCRPASCAYATSDSSPTVNAPRCCRGAFSCSAARRERQLRRLNHLPKRLTHSGTARSAEAPCASSNGSPLPNSCFAHHLNQTSAQHEALSISAAFARASARMRIPRLICPRLLSCLSLQPSTDTSLRCFTAPSHHQSGTSYPTPLVPDPSAPDQTDSKYIAFHEGGFLQVAVSEAPPQRIQLRHCYLAGAPDTALRLIRSDQWGQNLLT